MYKFNKNVNNSKVFMEVLFMNKIIVSMISIIVIMGAIITAVFVFNQKKDTKLEYFETKIADEEIIDDCTDEYYDVRNQNIEEASSKEEKISPNCFIIFKSFYKKCGHQVNQQIEIPEKLVNRTREELENEYKNWNIEKFSDTEIILTKEEQGECGEHYIVKDKNGKVAIYELLENNMEREYEVTDISTEYLTNEDRVNIEKGIKVNGKQELNQLIEDFE